METKQLVITSRAVNQQAVKQDAVKQQTYNAVFPLLQRCLTFIKKLSKRLTASTHVNLADAYEGHPDKFMYTTLRRDL